MIHNNAYGRAFLGFGHLGSDPTLKKGDSGPAVKSFQHELWQWFLDRQMGNATTSNPPNGVFDAATTDLVLALQKLTGIAVDGIVGPKTWAAMRNPMAPITTTSALPPVGLPPAGPAPMIIPLPGGGAIPLASLPWGWIGAGLAAVVGVAVVSGGKRKR